MIDVATMVSQREGLASAVSSVQDAMLQAAEEISDAFYRGNKLMVCGNGGSAADSQHMVAELVGRFEKDRDGFSALSLTVDSSILTAVGNDWSFDDVFRRQVRALGKIDDVLVGISTSGKSKNVLGALELARSMSIKTVGLVGGSGGDMSSVCDVLINVGGMRTPIIQERHLVVEHILCELIEEMYALKRRRVGCKTYCFDVDGTICKSTGGQYESAQPYPKRIAQVNQLYDAGNTVFFYTARGTVTGIDHRELTERQLREWGVRYHELRFGKPQYDLMVDDRAVSDVEFFGFFKE